MIKILHFIAVVPGNLCFTWEVEAYLESLKRLNYINNDNFQTTKVTILVALDENYIKFENIWKKLQDRYKEVEFSVYETDSIKKLSKIYPPVIRPHILKQHFKLHPELKDEVIFYTDSDIILTKPLPFYKWMDDDICYLSSTSYIGAKYFDSKEKDVFPFKLKEYNRYADVLNKCCNIVGIDPEIVKTREFHTGGCQYLLKDIDHTFWEKLEKDCFSLYIFCKDINGQFFPSEERGFQSWAIGDMCGLLWNLWLAGKYTMCPKELNFNWNTTPIDEWDKYSIYHNAGVISTFQEIDGVKIKMFNKSDSRFRTDLITPFDIQQFKDMSSNYCGYNYLQFLLSIKDPVSKSEGLLTY